MSSAVGTEKKVRLRRSGPLPDCPPPLPRESSATKKQEEIHDNIREPSTDYTINTWIALACVVLWQNYGRMR